MKERRLVSDDPDRDAPGTALGTVRGEESGEGGSL